MFTKTASKNILKGRKNQWGVTLKKEGDTPCKKKADQIGQPFK